jgi:fatty-acyl-CoA synthase
MHDWSRDWVASNAVLYGDAPALEDVETGTVRSWRQLDDRVGRVAGVLRGRFGVGRGDRVVVLAEGDPRIFELMFACMRLGAIMVPLNWRLSDEELATLCHDVEPTVVVHDGVWQATAVAMADKTGVTGLAGWRCTDTPCDFDRAADLAVPVRGDDSRQHPSDPAMILHTSGTTGVPKGAITTAATMAWQTLNTAQEGLLTGPGVKQLNPLPLFHAGGLTTLAAPMLRTGGCVATARRFDPDQAMAYLCRPGSGVTHMTLPPVMYQLLAETSAFASADLSQLRWTQVAGGVPARSLLDVWGAKGVVLQQAYGGTEHGPAVTTMPRHAVAARPTSCGRAVPFTAVRLAGADGSAVDVGGVGEIWISGPSVTPGYWGRAPGGDFEDGWFRTGDAAYCDEDGYYYLVDRLKDMYKSGGENVYPAEVERLVAEHPDVVEVAVVAVADDRWGEVGRAFVVLAPGRTLDMEGLRSWCEGRIARYKLPKSLVIVDGPLPRNVTGKVQKSELRSWTKEIH